MNKRFMYCIIPPLQQLMQMKKGRTCNHFPHRTCFGTPPSEALGHEEMHLVFPLLAEHQRLRIQKQLFR